jgi:hypothetical protein
MVMKMRDLIEKFKQSKWASRKLWTLIGTALFVILTDILGLKIEEETYWAVVSLAVSYILGQGYADGKKAEKNCPFGSCPTECTQENCPLRK